MHPGSDTLDRVLTGDVAVEHREVLPFERDFPLPYGIFYRPEPNAAARRFLEFIRATYTEGNASGIVPVL